MKRYSILILGVTISALLFGYKWIDPEPRIEGHGVVTYYGGAEGVSGSLAVIRTRDGNFILDCGSFYPEGEDEPDQLKAIANRHNQTLPRNVTNAHALLLTHAHADHIGRVPLLVRRGFAGSIYSTDATKQLSEVMLEMGIRWEAMNLRQWEWSGRSEGDFVVVHWNKCEWQKRINNRNRRQFSGDIDSLRKQVQRIDSKSISPCKICARIELKTIMRLFSTIEESKRTSLTENVSAEFFNSSHIPGAVSIMFYVKHNERYQRVLFSGDVGSDSSALIYAPEIPPAADIIFMEATYGASNQVDNSYQQRREFRQQIVDSLRRNNIVWIPAFALDRTQKILHELYLIQKEHPDLLNDIPVYVPSPSANNFTDIYIKNIANGWFRSGITTSSFEKVKQISHLPLDAEFAGPMIIITTSGMMDNVLSNQLIPALGTNADVDIYIVGYQSPITEGAHIRDNRLVTIDGKEIEIKASVFSTAAFSGHGRASDMDIWLSNQSKETPIYLLHGDREALMERQRDLMDKGWQNVHIAKISEPINF